MSTTRSLLITDSDRGWEETQRAWAFTERVQVAAEFGGAEDKLYESLKLVDSEQGWGLHSSESLAKRQQSLREGKRLSQILRRTF